MALLFTTSVPQGKAVGAMKSASPPSLPGGRTQALPREKAPRTKGRVTHRATRGMDVTLPVTCPTVGLRVGAAGALQFCSQLFPEALHQGSGESQLSHPVAPPGCQSRLLGVGGGQAGAWKRGRGKAGCLSLSFLLGGGGATTLFFLF